MERRNGPLGLRDDDDDDYSRAISLLSVLIKPKIANFFQVNTPAPFPLGFCNYAKNGQKN